MTPPERVRGIFTLAKRPAEFKKETKSGHHFRIVSFLPSATELAFALGLGDDVVGVSHECDYPPAARSRPAVVHCAIPLDGLTAGEIDLAISAQLRVGGSIYTVDTDVLKTLAPDLILAQDLCEVCAPSGNETECALAALEGRPKVLTLAPRSLAEIQDNLRQLGEMTGRSDVAQTLIGEQNARLRRLGELLGGVSPRRIFFMEWIDPIYCGGHWVPEQIELAGGVDGLARTGADSVRVAFEDVVAWAPEILVVSPCGAHLDDAADQARTILADERWQAIPAVQSGNVFAVDASDYFARPGPRVFDGVELLAHLFHPERMPEAITGASRRIAR